MKSLLIAISIAASLSVSISRASTVAAGYDLYETNAADTSFSGLGNLMGVPLGTFNFGGTVGVQNTGPTDTIIQRNAAATVASPPGTASPISITLVAIQLETVAPVNFMGDGTANYFLTLGGASTGTETISFNAAGTGGTFSTSLTITFDIRKGSLTGTIEETQTLTLTSSGAFWGQTPPPGTVLINGANNLLDGTNHNQDIFLAQPLSIDCSQGGVWCDGLADPSPEPGTAALMLIPLGAFGLRRLLQSIA
jgi:hypothetical protein